MPKLRSIRNKKFVDLDGNEFSFKTITRQKKSPSPSERAGVRPKRYITRKRFIASVLREQTKETLVRLAVELGKKLEVRDKVNQSLRIELAKLRATKLLRS